MVNMWFSCYWVRAMFICEVIGNLGSIILIPLMTLVIVVWDWWVVAMMGVVVYLVFILLFILFFKELLESMGLLFDGADEDLVEKVCVVFVGPGFFEI